MELEPGRGPKILKGLVGRLAFAAGAVAGQLIENARGGRDPSQEG
jgi:hypothetical protein